MTLGHDGPLLRACSADLYSNGSRLASKAIEKTPSRGDKLRTQVQRSHYVAGVTRKTLAPVERHTSITCTTFLNGNSPSACKRTTFSPWLW
jgi:hypothetical protein